MRFTIENNNKLFLFLILFFLSIFGSFSAILFYVCAIWAIYSYFFRNINLKMREYEFKIFLLMLIYILWNILSSLYNYDVSSNLIENIKYAAFIAPLFMSARFRLSHDRDFYLKLTLYACSIAPVVALPLVILETYVTGTRSELASGNALPFATVISLQGAVALIAALGEGSKKTRLLGLCGAAAAFAIVLLNGSRMPFLSMTITYFVLICIFAGPRFVKLFRLHPLFVGLGSFAVLIIAGTLVTFTPLFERTSRDLQNLDDGNPNVEMSLYKRKLLIVAGWNAFLDSPIIGHGLTNRTRVTAEYLPEELKKLGTKEITVVTSWHRFFSPQRRQQIVEWEISRWRERKASAIRKARETGSLVEFDEPMPGLERSISTVQPGFSHFHNAYLTALVDSGAVGFVLYAVLIFLPVYISKFKSNSYSAMIKTFGIGLAVSSIFSISSLTNLMFEHDILLASYLIFITVIFVIRSEDFDT